jgi:hypothetical protein
MATPVGPRAISTPSTSEAPQLPGSGPRSAVLSPAPLWRRWLVPPSESPRHAMRALVVGFLLEALTEVYQLVMTPGPAHSSTVGYYLSLATTGAGFYFLWRGLHECNALDRQVSARRTGPSARESLTLLVGGVVAVAAWDVLLGSVSAGDAPAPLAWAVGGVMVLAVGGFFLSLARRVAPFQRPLGRSLGWAAFAWSLGTASLSGLVLGQGIVGLFIDFFTSWPALILALGPFVSAISPLCVAFALIAMTYADAYPRAPASSQTALPPAPRPD